MQPFQKIAEANQVFTPGAPVQTKDLFSGRSEQLARTLEALTAPGRHPVIFGQRGVGKTSLANVLKDVFQSLLSVKISCDGGDTFATIWNRVFKQLQYRLKNKHLVFRTWRRSRQSVSANFSATIHRMQNQPKSAIC